METLQDRVLPLAYGVAGRCVGLVQGACFALQTARASLFQRTKESAQDDGAAAADEPLTSPEKKQRIRSPSPSPEKEDKPDADKEQPQEPQPQPQQEAPKTEPPKAEQQPGAEQQPAAAAADSTDALPADPTPAEAAGTQPQQQDGEITKLEDVTGVQQPEETFAEAAAKPPAPDTDIVVNGADNSASENTGSTAPSTATANAAASKASSGGGKKKRSHSRKRKNGHK